MDNEERKKLLLAYENLLKRLDKAESWAIKNNLDWDDVKVNKYKVWRERDNIIKEIEFIIIYLITYSFIFYN